MRKEEVRQIGLPVFGAVASFGMACAMLASDAEVPVTVVAAGAGGCGKQARASGTDSGRTDAWSPRWATKQLV
jgi:hypothetical protein